MRNDVSTQDAERLGNLLSKYRGCFAFKLEQLGCTVVVSMDIKEVPGRDPVVTRPYKATSRKEISRTVQEWKTHGTVTYRPHHLITYESSAPSQEEKW